VIDSDEVRAACYFVNFCSLTQAAQAAWVQAIGSILALAIAVAIPFFQWRAKEIRRKEQARSLALLVMNDIVEVHDRIVLVLSQSDLSEPALLNEGIERMLVVPPDLLAWRKRLHQLGPVSSEVIRMVAIMQMTRAELLNYQHMMRERPEYRDISGDPNKVRGGMREIADLAASAATRISKLFGEEPIVLKPADESYH
jgi:hypothetical protein